MIAMFSESKKMIFFVYYVRLSDPRTCPYNGKRNDSCDCSTIRESDYGKTVFNKIRIDVIDLYIIGEKENNC